MAGWLDNPMLTLLEKGLDASSLRQKVLANNVANVDTPGFKRSDVDFQAVLDETIGQDGTLSLETNSNRHLQAEGTSTNTAVVTDNSTSIRNDGNNVDIDREMTNVAENGLYYNSLTTALSDQLAIMRMVINGK